MLSVTVCQYVNRNGDELICEERALVQKSRRSFLCAGLAAVREPFLYKNVGEIGCLARGMYIFFWTCKEAHDSLSA